METRYVPRLIGPFLGLLLILLLMGPNIPAVARNPVCDGEGAAASSMHTSRPQRALLTDVSGAITEDTTWTVGKSPYVVTGDVTVNNSVTLTVDPGVEVRFDGNHALIVRGTLDAEGTASQPIVFTSNQAEPAPGDWAFLDFRSDSTASVVRHAVVEYGGNETRAGWYCVAGAVCVNTDSLALDQSTVQHSATRGLVLSQSDAMVTGNAFHANAEEGIRLHYCNFNAGPCCPSISGNSFTQNASAIHFNSGQDPLLFGNQASDNDTNGVVLATSSFRGDNIWEADMPYVVPAWCTLGAYGAGLVNVMIEPGAVIKIGEGGGLSVGYTAVVSAAGTAELPITITSIKDDTVGGDTNNDGGATAPASRDYCHVLVSGVDASALFEYTAFRYGGGWGASQGPNIWGDYEGALTLRACEVGDTEIGISLRRGARLTLEGSILHDIGYAGIYADSDGEVLIKGNQFVSAGKGVDVVGGYPTIEGNVFRDNAVGVNVHGTDCGPLVSPNNQFQAGSQVGVLNAYPEWVTIDARYNWWGDGSGPYHPFSNPDGTGNQVGNGVRYDPWLQAFDWLTPWEPLLHGVESLRWAAFGRDGSDLSVQVSAQGETTHLLGSDLVASGGLDWDTTAVADGRYELHATWRNITSTVVGEATRDVGVNNAASLAWHGGWIEADEAWTAEYVHVVEEHVTIAPTTTVTVAPGAVVKFAPETKLTVEGWGLLDAQGTDESPIVFTALTDDAAGGDTNLDGDASAPQGGDWLGIHIQGGGQFAANEHVEVRYAIAGHGGAITAEETWSSDLVHHLTDDVTVESGATLTLEPGTVVKLSDLKSIVIESGGSLVAEGTVAEPVVFTSLYDDAWGGDSNGDGALTAPAPGDWLAIYVDGGEVQLEHVEMRYGGGTTTGAWNYSGALRTANDAAVQVRSSIIAHSFYDGLLVQGGETALQNSIVADNDRGLVAWLAAAAVDVVNCTFDDNRIGLLAHGGTLEVVNTVVAHSLEVGIDRDITPDPTVRYCDVWSEPSSGAVDYRGVSDRTGIDGNISADPLFKDRASYDYGLSAGSPAIDAADGTVAPETDLQGSPRFNDPTTHNTGTPTPSGAYADMGALEFVETAHSDIDLVIESVTGPISGTQDDLVTVSWTGANTGTAPATGAWHDAIYLSGDTLWTPDDVLLGEALHSGDVGAGESYSGTAEVPLPGVTPGDYVFIVRANSRAEVFEGLNAVNNATAAAEGISMDIPALTLGVAAAGELSGDDDARYYKVTVPEGDDLKVDLDGPEGAVTELYVRFGAVPSRQSFDARGVRPNQADQSVSIAGVRGGDSYYILVYGADVPGSGAFTLTAGLAGFSIDRASPIAGANVGHVTLSIYGAQFVPDSQPRLIDSGGATLQPTAVYFVDSGLLAATFDLAAAALGPADVQVVNPGAITISLPDAFEVAAGRPGALEASFSVPSAVRPRRPFEIVIEYRNRGGTDLLAPLMRFAGTGNTDVRLSADGAMVSDRWDLVAVSPVGPAGILAPGGSGRITLYAETTALGEDHLVLSEVPYPEGPIDWSTLESSMRPINISDEAWAQLLAQLRASLGEGWEAYQAALAEDASLLPPLLGPNYALDQLFALESDKALAELTPSVRGTVLLSPTLRPLGNVTVRLFDPDLGEAYSAVSLNDGTFLMPDVVSGTYEISFDGAVPVGMPDELAVGPDGASGVTLLAQYGACIGGAVVDSRDGAPLPDMLVSATSQERASHVATTAADGTYALDSLPAGEYEITASGEGFVTAAVTLTLDVGEQRSGVNLALGPGATISGTVTGLGSPIAGATVSAVGSGGTGFSATTDGSGRYTVGRLASRLHTVYARAPGFVATSVPSISVPAAGFVTGVDVALAQAGGIAGAVTDASSGGPVASLVVSTSLGSDLYMTTTDQDGHFALTELPPGEYPVVTASGDHMSTRDTCTVAAGVTTTLDLALSSRGVVSGTVTNAATGAPLPKVPVYAINDVSFFATATDADGRYELDGFDGGTYRLTFGDEFAPGLDSVELTFDAAHTASAVDFETPVSGIVSGTVLAADGVTPIAGALVALTSGDEALVTMPADEAGRYAFVVVTDGGYGIEAAFDGLVFPPLPAQTVDGGIHIPDLDLVAGDDVINGTVEDAATGLPVADADVTIVRSDPNVALTTAAVLTTGVDGTFTITGAVPGGYRVLAEADGFAASHESVAVNAGVPSTVTIELEAESTISGVVTSTLTGTTLEAAFVVLVSQTDEHVGCTALSDASGEYRLDGLAPDTYTMVFLAEDHETAVMRDVTLGQEDRVIDVPLGTGTITVGGVVEGPNGPLSQVSVAAADAAGLPVAWATTDGDGAFALTMLPAGTYSVTVSGFGYHSAAPVPLVVSAGGSIADLDITLVPVGVSDVEITVDLDKLAHPPLGELLNPPRKGWILTQEDIDNQFNEKPIVLKHCGKRIENASLHEDLAYSLFDQLSAYHRGIADWLKKRVVDQNARISRNFSIFERSAGEYVGRDPTIGYSVRKKVEDDVAEARERLNAAQRRFEHGNYEPASTELALAALAIRDLSKIVESLDPVGRNIGTQPTSRAVAAKRLVLVATVKEQLRVLERDLRLLSQDLTASVFRGGSVMQYVVESRKYATTVRRMQEAFRTMNDCVEYYDKCAPGGSVRSSSAADLPDYCTLADPAQLEDGDQLDNENLDSVGSFDPNDKLGPAGFGAQGFVQPGVLPYEILFENDPDLGATVPAQEVFVTDTLDEDLDVSTLAFTGFGFDNRAFSVPPGLAHYETTIDLRPEGIDLLVPVVLDLDARTRTLMATFRSLDPVTGQLPDDVDAGFLPVNDKELHNGEGFFSYLVRPKDGLASGSVITNEARIVFDVNPPIDTPVTLHTLDTEGPSSSVQSLPAESPPGFCVAWEGQDDPGGSGIVLYEMYVSEDGGPYTRWLTATTASSAAYPGVGGSTYRFYSVAVDGVGHREAPPVEPDAVTSVVNAIYLPLVLRD